MNQKPITSPNLSSALSAKAKDDKTLPAVAAKNAIAQQEYDRFSDFMQRHKADFEMVIPTHLKPERVIRLAVSACRRNPELLTCDLATVIGGLLESAALGLEVNTPLHHASLIPFRNNKTQRKEAQFIIEYRGYVELYYRHPKVLSVFANVVYEKDIFRVVYGTEEKLEHIPVEEGDPGPIKGFYAYVKMKDDAYRFIYLPKSKVDKIRDVYSKGYQSAVAIGNDDTPWVKDYEAMGMKTAIRRLERFVPKSPEIGRGVDADFKVINPLDADFVAPIDDSEDSGKDGK